MSQSYASGLASVRANVKLLLEKSRTNMNDVNGYSALLLMSRFAVACRTLPELSSHHVVADLQCPSTRLHIEAKKSCTNINGPAHYLALRLFFGYAFCFLGLQTRRYELRRSICHPLELTVINE
jgi:hypothetical protein